LRFNKRSASVKETEMTDTPREPIRLYGNFDITIGPGRMPAALLEGLEPVSGKAPESPAEPPGDAPVEKLDSAQVYTIGRKALVDAVAAANAAGAAANDAAGDAARAQAAASSIDSQPIPAGYLQPVKYLELAKAQARGALQAARCAVAVISGTWAPADGLAKAISIRQAAEEARDLAVACASRVAGQAEILEGLSQMIGEGGAPPADVAEDCKDLHEKIRQTVEEADKGAETIAGIVTRAESIAGEIGERTVAGYREAFEYALAARSAAARAREAADKAKAIVQERLTPDADPAAVNLIDFDVLAAAQAVSTELTVANNQLVELQAMKGSLAIAAEADASVAGDASDEEIAEAESVEAEAKIE